jgi:hypothetical protein
MSANDIVPTANTIDVAFGMMPNTTHPTPATIIIAPIRSM